MLSWSVSSSVRTQPSSIMVSTISVLLLVSLSLASSTPLRLPQLPPLPPLPSLPFLPHLLQTVVTGNTGGVTTGVVTPGVVTPAVDPGVVLPTTQGVTTTVPAMMAMAPLLPAVALGIVKALLICELRCFRTNLKFYHFIILRSRGYQGHEAQEMFWIWMSSG